MKLIYDAGVLTACAETMAEALSLARIEMNANLDGYPLQVEERGDDVCLPVHIRQRAPSERRKRGEDSVKAEQPELLPVGNGSEEHNT